MVLLLRYSMCAGLGVCYRYEWQALSLGVFCGCQASFTQQLGDSAVVSVGSQTCMCQSLISFPHKTLSISQCMLAPSYPLHSAWWLLMMMFIYNPMLLLYICSLFGVKYLKFYKMVFFVGNLDNMNHTLELI